MQTDFTLYNGPDLWAAGSWFLPLTARSTFVGNLEPRNAGCNPVAGNDVQIELDDVEPVAGWLNVRARIVVEHGFWFGSYKPLVWYVDEPTDWHSGIARWVWPAAPADVQRGFHAVPETRWTLTARRSA